MKVSRGADVGLGQRFLIGKRNRHSIDLDYFYAMRSDAGRRRVETTDTFFDDESGGQLSLCYRYNF